MTRNLPEQKLYIHGRPRDALGGQRFETVNPASGEVICQVQQAGDGRVGPEPFDLVDQRAGVTRALRGGRPGARGSSG